MLLTLTGYLRLSLIACDNGKFEEATVWLSRALEINDDEPDVNICLGDLFSRGGLADEAKKCYEKMCNKVHTTIDCNVLQSMLQAPFSLEQS